MITTPCLLLHQTVITISNQRFVAKSWHKVFLKTTNPAKMAVKNLVINILELSKNEV
jgi:hypothetical protein